MMRKLVKATWLLLLAAVAIAVILYIGVIKLNIELPGSGEYELANAIVATVKKEIPQPPDYQILFEAANSIVTINIYGVLDKEDQERMVRAASGQILGQRPEIKKDVVIEMNFFPERTFIEHKMPDGSIVSELIKSNPVRSIKLK